jgi:hypothetical protein
MRIEFAWVAEDHCTWLYIRFHQGWTWDEFYSIHLDIQPYLLDQERAVDVIVDARGTHTVPPGFLSRLPGIISTLPPNIGRIVVVAASPVMRGLFTVFAGVYPTLAEHFSFVDSLEAARALLSGSGARR